MNKEEQLTIRPYARLLTMLGDQLIKDESIALIELIKNAYDADAEHVRVSFQNFNSDYSINNESKIIIEDDGNGMNEDVLKYAWMNPATPEKLIMKRVKETTDRGRIMQGEKGIGRFAIFKLGRKIEIISRRQKSIDDHFVEIPESKNEYILNYDFSDYDTDFLQKGNEEKDIYLDELTVTFEEREAVEIIPKQVIYSGMVAIRKPYGTKIIISDLNEGWNRNKIDKVNLSVKRMQPIFGEEFFNDFSVHIDVNDLSYIPLEKSLYEIPHILQEKSVFIVEGDFHADDSTIKCRLNSYKGLEEKLLDLEGPELRGISPMKDFLDSIENRKVECGSFSFKFFMFDLNLTSKNADSRYYLNQEEKKIIKAHRVYLYRDGIRVMPYGDPEDDWLKLDTIRGVESAGHIFGNDQIVGYVKISQKNNPKLRDKTNREGLVEDGYAREDLVNICQLILRYLRTKNYAQYLIDKKRKIEKKEALLNKPIYLINNARKEKIGKKMVESLITKYGQLKVSDIPSETIAEGQKVVDQFLDEFEQSYRKEVNVLENRISTTENLAAIGLSAETAYHDSRIILERVDSQLGTVLKNYNNHTGEFLAKNHVINDISPIKDQTSTVVGLMNNIQKLFPSTKNKKSQINVLEIILIVYKLYAESLHKANIVCEIKNTSRQNLIVESTDAVLLQVFINLFDNALYWLQTVDRKRQIIVEIIVDQRMVIFADSGPGVQPDDSPYIFEAFYSGKGDEGKGLGLYIARQLLGRYNSSIELIEDDCKKILNGANFVIKFYFEEE